MHNKTENSPRNCWEYHQCPNEIKNNCYIYKFKIGTTGCYHFDEDRGD